MKRFLLFSFIILFFNCVKVYSTHIVGGEFEMVHIRNFQYKLNLNLYFDHLHGDPGAEDQFIRAGIFKKSNNALFATITLNRESTSFIPYTNPECKSNPYVELETRRIIYSTNINLSPSEYNDPAGYYVVWERCCRNNVINNIREPGRTGQTFYLEFPPVVQGRSPFINSSPVLFPPLSDYAVVNQLYYFDFGGTDPDGDSLAYSLSVPLRGFSSPEYPAPYAAPAPYPLVTWANGISIANVIPGKLPLNIDSKGLLTVIPDRRGLFVFAVKCEEFRDGKKIGEVRRDFQMLVVEVEVGTKPEVLVKVPGSDNFYNEADTLKFAIKDDKCFDLFVTDKDGKQNITLKALPVNFEQNLNSILSVEQSFLSAANDTLKVQVCLPDCPYVQGEPFLIDFIAMDDACSLPLMDTLRVTILVESDDNQNPVFITPAIKKSIASVLPGNKFTLPLTGRDPDGDLMILNVLADGFEMKDFGMTVRETLKEYGRLNAVFEFDPDCEKFDFSLKNQFSISFILKDLNNCDFGEPDRVDLSIELKLESNYPPKVTTELKEHIIYNTLGTSVRFNIYANDTDNDYIFLTGTGSDFILKDYGMTFQNKEGRGSITSNFQWNPECENINDRDDFLIYFIAHDQVNCKKSASDTLAIRILILPPENEAPEVSINGLFSPNVKVMVGHGLELEIEGFDIDGDSIFLELAPLPGYENLNYSFTPAKGKGEVKSIFSWSPECSELLQLEGTTTFEFPFIVTDLNCINEKSDSLILTVELEDLVSGFSEFQPHNVFSPNNDDFNDYYEIDNLPPDNCYNQYVGINIFNRWGKLVFTDNKRDFKWDGQGMAAGVYYYVIKYTNKEYKGSVSILY
ncbi:hypothetical protein BH23BAC1_BH23BAC1_46760 [soil metagenome]